MIHIASDGIGVKTTRFSAFATDKEFVAQHGGKEYKCAAEKLDSQGRPTNVLITGMAWILEDKA